MRMCERKESAVAERGVALKSLSMYELLSLCISIIGLAAIIFVAAQAHYARKQIERNAQQALSSSIEELNMLFINNPALWPYFEEGKAVEKANTEQNFYFSIVAMADFHIDLIDSIWTQSEYIEVLQSDTDAWRSWDAWITDLFRESPIMCQRLNEVQCRFTRGYIEYVHDKCPDTFEIKACR